MEQITFEKMNEELVKQLEVALAKLTVAAEAKISTSELEQKAQRLASKLRASATIFAGMSLYKGVEGTKLYSWNAGSELPDDIFMAYATVCKNCREQLEVVVNDKEYYTKIEKNIYIKLDDIPPVEMPTFKVKLEGDTLMAVRADLLRKLPDNIRKLLENGE